MTELRGNGSLPLFSVYCVQAALQTRIHTHGFILEGNYIFMNGSQNTVYMSEKCVELSRMFIEISPKRI